MKIRQNMLIITWYWYLKVFLARLTNHRKGYGAQAFLGLPIVIVAKKEYADNKPLINHEKIHVIQGLETLFIGLWIMYSGHFLYNRIVKRMSSYDAYMNIIFEKEAYANQDNLTYLKKRRLWQWLKY